MLSLRDTSEIFGSEFAAASVDAVTWPTGQARIGSALSLRKLTERYAAAGAGLRALASGVQAAWADVPRAGVVAGLRARVRDPAIMRQVEAMFCGPIAIAFALARREPGRYVAHVASLFATGAFTTPNGRVLAAEAELLAGAMPSPSPNGGVIDPADWVFTATLRDDENLVLDIDGDDAKDGPSGLSTWFEMDGWTRDILNMTAQTITCVFSGEIDAIRTAELAVAAGGVAFLLIEATLIKSAPGDDEEDIGFRRLDHFGPNKGALQAWTHSEDDGDPMSLHWVVYLGGLELDPAADDDSTSPIELRLWSWGGEYVITGTAAAFSEYLYAVVLGT